MIDILKKSVVSRKGVQVLAPGGSIQGEPKIDFGELCSSGGIVNAYRAAQLAAQVSKQKNIRIMDYIRSTLHRNLIMKNETLG
nr:hypothetical protein [Paraflavitalea speifideiaquila]